MLMILTLAATVSAAEPDSSDLAQLHALYNESCANRAYATYDDMCNQLEAQVRQADRDAARRAAAERRHASEKRAEPAKAHAESAPAVPSAAGFVSSPK